MSIDQIVQQVGVLGFPAVAFMALFYLYDKNLKDLTVTLAKIDSTLTAVLEFVAGIDCPRKKEKGDSPSD